MEQPGRVRKTLADCRANDGRATAKPWRPAVTDRRYNGRWLSAEILVAAIEGDGRYHAQIRRRRLICRGIREPNLSTREKSEAPVFPLGDIADALELNFQEPFLRTQRAQLLATNGARPVTLNLSSDFFDLSFILPSLFHPQLCAIRNSSANFCFTIISTAIKKVRVSAVHSDCGRDLRRS